MTANTAWADAIGKVLASQPKTKSVILAKAKKDKDVSSKRKTDDHDQLEIVQDDGSVVRVQDKTGIEDTRPRKKAKLSKHEWDVMGKLKPKTEDKEMERRLCSIATKGVVQLFNAVREQQTAIESKIKEVGTSETKRDKALAQFDKRQFLDKLKNKNKDKTSDQSEDKSTEQKWKVLRNDFMIGAKMKDWDKESDSEEE